MSGVQEKIVISHMDSEAEISLHGAELRRWTRAGQQMLWSGDARWWGSTAPILFPICGSLKGGRTMIDGAERQMTTHGFAMNATFAVAAQTADSVTLELRDSEASRAVYPYAFRLAVRVRLERGSLVEEVEVTNTGNRPMPYSVGIHPAFAFAGGTGEVEFERDEAATIPLVQNKLITSRTKPSGVVDRRVAIDTGESFKLGALCFFDARSRSLVFRDSAGQAMRVRIEGFPHLILWAAAGAEFLSVEAWSGHGDAEEFSGGFTERLSTTTIAPGETRRYLGEFTPL